MKNQRKFKTLFKRLISGVSALALSVGLLGSIPASADDSNVGYKYTLFAYSSEDGAISSSAANFCVNGNIATNGTISAGQNFNVNGEKKEHANEAMPDLSKAINEKFFAENVDVKAENYKNEDVNINVESPLDVKGKAELKGNIKLASGVKAMGDITLSGGVLNNDNTVLFSEKGNVVINSENVSLTGLVYAPKGNIVIDSKCLNLNSVVMIANKITLNSSNININNSASMAKFVQEAIEKNGGSNGNDEPEPEEDPVIYAYGEYNEETKSVDIEWYSNVTGEFAVLESMNGTDYTVVSKVSDDTKYSYKVTSDFIKKHFKVATIKGTETFESIPFTIVNANGTYSTELLDTDKDGLADLYEEMLGTDKTLPDTDNDGLTDYEEVYITNTDPTKYDSVTEGVSDADADSDKDGLNNKKEIELKTDPNSDDTDGDNLKDGDEISKYNTDPTKKDTDGDELEDDDELKFKYDPNKQDTDGNGIIDSKEKNQQSLEVVPDNKEQAVTKVCVSMSASGNIEKTTTVESIMDKDVLCSNVVGLVGEPFSIESESSFDKATITFTVDKTKLGETEFDNLMFLWYDRENDNFVELETSHDAVNSTVSIETTHFSEYMIVDSKQWFENWKKIEEEHKRIIENGSSIVHVIQPTATVVFSHCSDETDPEFLNQDLYSTTIYHQTNYRTLICEHLIDSMSVLDAMDIVRTKIDIIHQSVPKYFHTTFSNDKDYLKQELKYFLEGSYLTDNITRQIRTADSCLYTDDFAKDKKVKRIVFITDRDFYVDTNELIASSYDQTWAGKPMDYYQNYKSIPIYFVCIGEFNKSNLEKIARETGGKVFTVTTTSDVREFYNSTDSLLYDMNPKDSDGDGLTDFEEMCGVYNSAGVRIITDALDEDTDDDGLKDGDEIKERLANTSGKGGDKDIVKYYYYVKSDPTKADSDGDGINDKDDKYPLSRKLEFFDKLKELEAYIDEAISTTGVNIPNSIIAMNIIRSLNPKYRGVKWGYTAGDSYDLLTDAIRIIDSNTITILEDYNKTGKGNFSDPGNNEIDMHHMFATLSGQYNTSFIGKNVISIDKELSGWAGDLQTFIYDVKVNSYINDKTPQEVASDLITTKDSYFSLSDMLADIDAENIYSMYLPKMKLSEMLEDYYNNGYYKKRYTIFVERHGGLENLKKQVDKYTYGCRLVRHKLLHDKAHDAAFDKEVIKKARQQGNWDNSFVTKFGIVSEEESKALTCAFIDHIRERLEIESNE